MPELKIRQFDINSIQGGKVCVFVGRRGSGKTKLLINMMYAMRNKLKYGIAMSPTPDSVRTFRQFMPSSFCYNTFTKEAIKKTLDCKITYQREKCGGDENLDDYHVFVLMDDCMFDKKCVKGDEIRELLYNGRHMKIFHINIVQYSMDLPSEYRTNIDYVFVFGDNIRKNRIRLWEYYFGVFSKFEDFEKVFTQCTGNYECLVLDNTSKSTDISDKVFYFKANPNIEKFRVGSESYWMWDWRYGKQMSKTDSANIIENTIKNMYYTDKKERERLKENSESNKEFTVIKCPPNHTSMIRKRIMTDLKMPSGVRPSSNLRMDLDVFQTKRSI